MSCENRFTRAALDFDQQKALNNLKETRLTFEQVRLSKLTKQTIARIDFDILKAESNLIHASALKEGIVVQHRYTKTNVTRIDLDAQKAEDNILATFYSKKGFLPQGKLAKRTA